MMCAQTVNEQWIMACITEAGFRHTRTPEERERKETPLTAETAALTVIGFALCVYI
jgi:hypothetical protein